MFFAIACNLIEGIDVPAIEAKIAKYEIENAEQIMNARARKVCKPLHITVFTCCILEDSVLTSVLLFSFIFHSRYKMKLSGLLFL